MSASLVHRLRELLGLIKDTAVDLKTDFEEESKFQQMRILAIVAVLVDVVATAIVFVVLAQSGGGYEAWMETTGPSNVLMIRRGHDDLEPGVEVVLDGKYRAKVDLKGRASGFALDAVFVDGEGFVPARDYRPRKVELFIDGDRMSVPLGNKR